MPSSFRVEGLCAAPFTAFLPDSHDLNIPAITAQIAELKASGVNSAFVGGTTGESLSMTVAERKQLLEEWVRVGKEQDLVVIAHVGCESLRDTQELTAHAAACGAAAAGLMPPTFIKPATLDALVEFVAAVSSAAPELPMYYYHIACMTGVDFNMVSFLNAVEAKGIPNFNGIKFTDYKIHEFTCVAWPQSGTSQLPGGRSNLLHIPTWISQLSAFISLAWT